MSDPAKQAYVFHGDSSLSVGDTLYNAFDAIESLEHYCKVSIYARALNAIEGGKSERCEGCPATPAAPKSAAVPAACVPESATVNEVIRRVIAELNK
jgi:hypothetical protein